MNKLSTRIVVIRFSLSCKISLVLWALRHPQAIRKEIFARMPLKLRLFLMLTMLGRAMFIKNFQLARTNGMGKLRAVRFAARAAEKDLTVFFNGFIEGLVKINAAHAVVAS